MYFAYPSNYDISSRFLNVFVFSFSYVYLLMCASLQIQHNSVSFNLYAQGTNILCVFQCSVLDFNLRADNF